jgi:hypothetical protein
LPQRAESVDARHHQIEHDDGWPLALEPARQMIRVVQYGNLNAALLEKGSQQVAKVGIVVDE